MKLPLRVKPLSCEAMLAHILGAMQPCPYGAVPVTVVPKFQQVCLILEQQHADDAILLYAFGLRLISAYSKSLALCSFAPCRSFVRCPVVMSLHLYPCAFFLLSYPLPSFTWLWILSFCPSLMLSVSVGYLSIAAWFGVRVFFVCVCWLFWFCFLLGIFLWGFFVVWFGFVLFCGCDYFDYLHEIPLLSFCTQRMWNWQLQGGEWMLLHFRGRIISCNYPKSTWENRVKGMRERKRAWKRIITTLRQVYPIVFENLSLWQVSFVKGIDI